MRPWAQRGNNFWVVLMCEQSKGNRKRRGHSRLTNVTVHTWVNPKQTDKQDMIFLLRVAFKMHEKCQFLLSKAFYIDLRHLQTWRSFLYTCISCLNFAPEPGQALAHRASSSWQHSLSPAIFLIFFLAPDFFPMSRAVKISRLAKYFEPSRRQLVLPRALQGERKRSHHQCIQLYLNRTQMIIGVVKLISFNLVTREPPPFSL